MRNVEIKVNLIASTRLHSNAAVEWLSEIGADRCPLPTTEDQTLTDGAALIGLAAKRCYMSFQPGLNPNVTKVRKDWTDYFDNILKSGHGSVLEHAHYTFAIEGVSRVFTAEMNRHRAGVAISEGSMRYIRFDDIPWWMPDSIRENDKDDAVLAEKKSHTRNVFRRAFNQAQANYSELVHIWDLDSDKSLPFSFKKQITSCLRRIIPMGVATGGVWTMNLRAVRHILAMRSSAAAEEEIARVFSTVGKIVTESEPRIFGDFTQSEDGFWIPKYPKV